MLNSSSILCFGASRRTCHVLTHEGIAIVSHLPKETAAKKPRAQSENLQRGDRKNKEDERKSATRQHDGSLSPACCLSACLSVVLAVVLHRALRASRRKQQSLEENSKPNYFIISRSNPVRRFSLFTQNTPQSPQKQNPLLYNA